MTAHLRIGTSGWNYPSGKGTWNGIFYPKGRARPKGFDELSFYAEHFDTVEVNSTFYGQPRAEVCRAWADRTPQGFEFSVKLYQKFTHPEMFKERLRPARGERGGARGSASRPPQRDPSTELRVGLSLSKVERGWGPASSNKSQSAEDPLQKAQSAEDALLEALAKPNQADLDAFRTGIEPLAAAGKMGALLAQFPPGFKDSPASRDYLLSLIHAFAGYPLAVELRHRSWSDQIGDTLALLNSFGAAWVQIDEPKFRFSIRQNYLPNVKGFYYMRLHGRNVEKWWRHEKAEDRYDYLYSADELKEFAETANAARHLVKKAYLYTNNHFSAKSVANAAMIKQQLGEPLDGEYPPEFVAEYPDLANVVNVGKPSPVARRALL